MKKFLGLILLLSIACSNKKPMSPEEKAAYIKQVDVWHQTRLEELSREDGWLNLAGLLWLEPGMNSFGSDTTNNLVFPAGKISGQAGYFVFTDGSVKILTRPGAAITYQGNPVKEMVVFHPDSMNTPWLASGSLRWNIIKREDKIGIRLRDLESNLQLNFPGIERYPVDPDYRVETKLVPSDTLKTIPVATIIGQTLMEPVLGILSFEIKGKKHSLLAMDNGEKIFLMFADSTSGNETNGGGRYLYVKKPGPDGKVIIDFNEAINPPCAFTDFATCPLPPKENYMQLNLRAGEKMFKQSNGSH